METEEKKEDGKACGTKGKCCCCGGKALAAIVLLAVGGVGGYLCGRHCAAKTDAAPAAAAPASTPAK